MRRNLGLVEAADLESLFGMQRSVRDSGQPERDFSASIVAGN
jgi:hypothetical protein